MQVEDLARLSFKRNPLYVGIDDRQAEATREGLEQGYCIVPSAQRFLLLFTFLKKNASKKARHAPSAVAACLQSYTSTALLGLHLQQTTPLTGHVNEVDTPGAARE